MKRIVAIGDNVVDCYPAQGLIFPGGNTLNLSVFARRFGADSAYLGAVGTDAAGDLIRSSLAAEGVRSDRLRILPAPNAYCVIGHRPNGDRVFLNWDLSISLFTPDAADFAFVDSHDAVHVGQSSALDDHVARLGREAALSYDFSSRREPDHRAAIAPRCFLASFSGGDLEPGEIDALMAEVIVAGARWCLVTRGDKGAMLGSAAGVDAVPAEPAAVVDTLGAGDTFIARTLVGLLDGEAPKDALTAAARAAAATCGHYGATGHAAPMAIAAKEVRLVAE